MNCKDFQNQFEVGSEIKTQAKQHLKGCEDCQAFESEETQLTQMFKDLEKVEAPKDFEFRLNSYIAKTEQVKRPLPKFWQALRYALPLTAAVLIFGFVIVNSSLFADKGQNLAELADNNQFDLVEESKVDIYNEKSETQKPLINETKDTEESLDKLSNSYVSTANDEKRLRKPEFVKPVLDKPERHEKTKDISKTARKQDKPIEKDFSGSRNIASTQPEVLKPQNSKTAPIRSTSRSNNRLLKIGVLVESNSRKVTSIVKNSIAEKSGIKVGDILISISQKNNSTTLMKAKVLRNGKVIDISLVN